MVLYGHFLKFNISHREPRVKPIDTENKVIFQNQPELSWYNLNARYIYVHFTKISISHQRTMDTTFRYQIYGHLTKTNINYQST